MIDGRSEGILTKDKFFAPIGDRALDRPPYRGPLYYLRHPAHASWENRNKIYVVMLDWAKGILGMLPCSQI